MKLRLLLVLVLLCIGYMPYAAPLILKNTSVLADDEYDRYKKRGDDFFRQGDYEKAHKQYENCLEVPGFANDTYAKSKIKLCDQSLALRQRSENAQKQNKGSEAVEFYKQILAINAEDPITKKHIADFWEDEGTKFYENKMYVEAKKRYEEAIKYAEKKNLLAIQIQNCEQFIKQIDDQAKKEEQTRKDEQAKKDEQARLDEITKKTEQAGKDEQLKKDEQAKQSTKPIDNNSGAVTPINLKPHKRSPVLMILTAVAGLGAGGYAYLLNKDFSDKRNTLIAVAQTTDPDGDNVILTQQAYNQWQTAYNNAKAAQSEQTTFYACLGVAAGAAVVEVMLLSSKPKKAKGLSFKPASQSAGIALRFDF